MSAESKSVSEISRVLHIDRKTVRRYRDMDEKTFAELAESNMKSPRPGKLAPYYDFTLSLLKDRPMLSCPQVHDRLLENFESFPDVTPRTVYSFVMKVRRDNGIPVASADERSFSRVPRLPLGRQMQVDYGQCLMENRHGGKTKVWFLAFAMSSSCYKFAYAQSYPFKTRTAIYAHHMAFGFFGGVPEEVVYDQDVTFLRDENYGDYKLVAEFAPYVAEAGFRPYFCKAHDPTGKGRIERYVRHFKEGFFRGRVYVNDIALNEEIVGWLGRTGNRNRHSVYGFVPFEEFQKERPLLSPYSVDVEEPEIESVPRYVKKDNTISFGQNLYEMPRGTYKSGGGTRVLVVKNAEDDELEIYSEDTFDLIVRYPICAEKNRLVRYPDPRETPSKTVLKAESDLRSTMSCLWTEDETGRYLKALHDRNPRYYRQALSAAVHSVNLCITLGGKEDGRLAKLAAYMLEAEAFNPQRLADYLSTLPKSPAKPPLGTTLPGGLSDKDVTPATRPLSEYEQYLPLPDAHGKDTEEE